MSGGLVSILVFINKPSTRSSLLGSLFSASVSQSFHDRTAVYAPVHVPPVTTHTSTRSATERPSWRWMAGVADGPGRMSAILLQPRRSSSSSPSFAASSHVDETSNKRSRNSAGETSHYPSKIGVPSSLPDSFTSHFSLFDDSIILIVSISRNEEIRSTYPIHNAPSTCLRLEAALSPDSQTRPSLLTTME